MIRFVLLTWLGLWTNVIGYGQSVDCQTIGFEDGSFGGWERWTGEVSPYTIPLVYQLEPGSLHSFNNQYGHLITQVSDGYDPNVRERIPVVAPGSQHSVRVGDLDVGGSVDQLRANFVVPADKPLLRYQFAAVLQIPNHRLEQQPGLSLLIRTQTGDTIACGYSELWATRQAAGFTYQQRDDFYDPLIYCNWTSHVLDLRAYVGQTLRLEFTTHDCGEGGHYGYAYFDAQCVAMTVTASSICQQGTNQMRLAAPEGFNRYRWSTGDTTATIQIKPQLGNNYWVDVSSQSFLRPTCQTTLRLTYQVDQLLIPTVQQVRLCPGESYSVGDSLYTKSGTYRHVFHRPSGCDSLLITDVMVRQLDVSPPRDTVVVKGDSVQLVVKVPPGANYEYSWSPPADLSCPSCPVTWASPSQPTLYHLSVQIPNTACQARYELTVDVLTCLLALPNSFTPNGDGLNDSFAVFINPCLGRLRQLTIYNRWGQAIHHQELNSALEKTLSWDGTYRGEPVQMGVYSYQLILEPSPGQTRKHTGTVTLIR